MSLLPGTRLGPYEIVAPLGAGGMGEVYRARDTKLRRDVAVKVLPESLSRDADALARFEREALAVAALSHPNILSIFDFGSYDGTAYAVMELLEGETLRDALEAGPLPPRKSLACAREIAEGLFAAHEKGIVHRDLKPENVFLAKDGHVKILDFGLAKQTQARSDNVTSAPTDRRGTEPGTVMGTAGYMSPEQVRGQAVDHRSDIFSFGAILYEMLSGRRAFRGASAADSMAAILREEPPEIPAEIQGIAPGLERVVRHCLEKRPEQRFQSARDLAFDLEALSSVSSPAARTVSVAASPGIRRVLSVAIVALLALAAGAAWWAGARHVNTPHPVFRSLTRERGTLGAARFVPGTSDVAYGARWGLGAPQVYITRTDQPAPRVLPGFEGLLQAVSASAEVMGLSDTYISHASPVGRLVSLPLSGGAARPWADQVWSASWDERGDAVVVFGAYGDEFRLEWPLGHVVTRSHDVLRAARVRGEKVAYFREQGDTFENGVLVVVGRDGSPREIFPVTGFTGLAWGPDGTELWVSTAGSGQSRIEAVDMRGHSRTLLTHAGRLEIQDVDAAGRVLAVVHWYQRQVFGRAREKARDEDIGWLDAQAVMGITADGKQVLLAHLGQWSRTLGHFYLRPLAGGPALDMGSGDRQPTLSADGLWVVTCTNDPAFSLRILPTGPGTPRQVPIPEFAESDPSVFPLPGCRRAIIAAHKKGSARALFSVDLENGAVRQVAPDGASNYLAQTLLSPDGEWMAFLSPQPAGLVVSRVDGTDLQPVRGVARGEAVSGWYRDSSTLVVFDRNVLPAPVVALDRKTGKRTPLWKLMPPDPVGISGVQGLMLATDGGAYAYNVIRQLSELYLVDGLK